MKTKTLLKLLIASQIALTSQLALARADIGGPQAETLDQVKEKIMRGELKKFNFDQLPVDKRILARLKAKEIGSIFSKLEAVNRAAESRLLPLFTTKAFLFPTTVGLAVFTGFRVSDLVNKEQSLFSNKKTALLVVLTVGLLVYDFVVGEEIQDQLIPISFSGEELRSVAIRLQTNLEKATNEFLQIVGPQIINQAKP